MKIIIYFLTFIFSFNSLGDQCQYMDPLSIKKAEEVMSRAKLIVEFCEPCDNAKPRKITFDKNRKRGSDIYYEGKKMTDFGYDAAYIFIKSKGSYVNLASMLTCPTQGVSKKIDFDHYFKSNNKKTDRDKYKIAGKYWSTNPMFRKGKGYAIEISYDGQYHFSGTDVTTQGNILSIDNELMIKVDSENFIIGNCNLKIKLLKKNTIKVDHDISCGGMGTSLEGEWEIIDKK